jgi:hypothetical protein
VVDNRTTTDSGVANELLAQFNNVAYFKNEEDDATFWNRLISVDDRTALEQEQHTELLPRAARLKPEERAALGLQGDSGDSEAEGEEGGGSAGKKTGAAAGAKKARPRARAAVKRDAASGEPGPPVDGAALRVDEWLLDVGPDGRPLKQVRAEWVRAVQRDGGQATEVRCAGGLRLSSALLPGQKQLLPPAGELSIRRHAVDFGWGSASGPQHAACGGSPGAAEQLPVSGAGYRCLRR